MGTSRLVILQLEVAGSDIIMHHALLIPDVQAYLFAIIKDDKQMGRYTLAMLARTCSVLSEASLDVLWSDLDALWPLARCIYTANTTPLTDEACLSLVSITFQAEPLPISQSTPEANNNSEPDLSVFYKYAHRVRTLELSKQRKQQTSLRRHNGCHSVMDDFFALIYYAIPSPILPNLRQLICAPGMSLNLLHHLLNPNLRSLTIYRHRWTQESTQFALNKLPGLCPEITSLTLQILAWDGYPEPESLVQSYISRVICCWEKLEELDCNPTASEGVLLLCGLPSLKILRLQITHKSVANLPSHSLTFPSLHTLQFKCDSLETAIALMGAIKSSPKSVAIDVYVSHYSSELVGVLLHLVSRHKLQYFSMNFPCVMGADSVNVSDMLRPLFPCELRILRIVMTLQLTLGDDGLRIMAAAWPRLEKLELIDSRPQVLVSSPLFIPGLDHPNQPPQPPPPMPPAGSIQATQPQLPQPPAQVNTNLPFGPAIYTELHSPDQIFRVGPGLHATTFHGLISLLGLCPRLHYFDLNIDASKLDGLQGDKPGGGVCNRLVKRAKLMDLPVGDPEVVARILLNILPELDSLSGENALSLDPPHHVTLHRWLAVHQIMVDSKQRTNSSPSAATTPHQQASGSDIVMHHALLIPDVQVYLFAIIRDDKQMGRYTLAMLARTCSVLSEASLDVLWSDLDALWPLARCIYTANTTPLTDEACLSLVSITFQAEPLPIPQSIPEANNNTVESDLSVFYKYAHRVRTLDLSGQRRFLRRNNVYHSVIDDVFALISCAMPFPILPNLRQLIWAPGMSLDLLCHLLNPHLVSLKISTHRWSPESTPFALNKIPGLCPEITSLTLQILALDGYPEPELAQNCISRVICSWEKLEELDCNPTTREGVLRLCGLPSLRILRLQVNSQSVANLPLHSLSFPSLHTLQFEVDSLETAVALMGAIKSSPKSVAIDVYAGGSRHSPELVEVLLHLIGRDASHHKLQYFSMNFPCVLGADPVNVCDMLRPLFLCDLRILRLAMTLRFILGDDHLRMMAAAWPRLEKLELIDSRPRVLIPSPQLVLSEVLGPPNQPPQPLPPMPPAGSIQAITFHGLISLLELCPRLHYFDLAIDASKLNGLQRDKPGGGVFNRLVRRARLIDSPVGDPEVVARILLDILPELDSLTGENALLQEPPHNVVYQEWLAVHQIMVASKHATT
ncbi:hypothetical protein AZE42_07697 [Rhizopogon vesiculosus]|uniref:F-box domain-containing protein n=1 Tax=Rhizopogon vesiculosus TaxID=180088 RepID=A0A1J8PE39_9AGAM|nr:hypothetical protein AZE42_07697 [Rhizopogon vesiculosus]